jgi:anti-sigma regulatory factor (Ser/Thr protein kinase)
MLTEASGKRLRQQDVNSPSPRVVTDPNARNGQGRGDVINEDSAADAVSEVSETFTLADLHRVRVLVARTAQPVGLSVAAINNLVAAVNEIAINAIMHAGGHGHLSIRAVAHGIEVQISDSGPGLPDAPNVARPDNRAIGGRGLWLARRMCPTISFLSSPHGLTVQLIVAVP